MKVLAQVNKFTFEELDIPDEEIEQLYKEWHQKSLYEIDIERFDTIELLRLKSPITNQ